MQHLWNRIKKLILFLIAIFVICFVITLLGNVDLAANISTFIIFVLPLYLIYLGISEIRYHHDLKKKSNNLEKVTQTNNTNDTTLQVQKNKGVNDLHDNVKEKHDTKNEPVFHHTDSEIKKDQTNKSNNTKGTHSELSNVSSSYAFMVTPTSIETVQHSSSNKKVPYTIHHLRRSLYNFVVVDCETTGLKRNSKVIQLSAIRYYHDRPVETFNEYINPEMTIPEKVTLLTGIDDEKVKNSHKFSEVADRFTQFVRDLPWVGHNINSFDIPILVNNGIQLDDFKTIDTLPLSRKKLNMPHYGLENLKKYYGIQNMSHDSLEDCKTTAVVYQHLRDNLLDPVNPDYSSVPQTLVGKQFAISGNFQGYSRSDVEELVRSHGGIVKGISHRTDYLIDGQQTSKALTDSVHSNKELKAREYGIPVLSLNEFKKIMESN